MTRSKEVGGSIPGFPIDHYSYSAWEKLSTDPFMFKVNYLNGDTIDTASSPTNAIGRSMHKALEAYYAAGKHSTAADEGDAIKLSHDIGTEFLAQIHDGFIDYNKTIASNRSQLEERFASTFFGYMKENDFDHKDSEILLVERMLKHKVHIDGKELPIPLKGQMDLVYRKGNGRIRIRDYKFTGKFSDLDSIDASKLVQAVYAYFLVYAETGEEPEDMCFDEFKVVPNKDGSPQTHRFVINFSDTPLMFDLFFRLYGDITDALMGKQAYIPNFRAMFDREVSILAYIHRLDMDEDKAKQLKKMKVSNITDFLKRKIQRSGSMNKYLEAVSTKFVSATTLNYSKMKTEDKIKMKLAEHGLGVEFDSKITGSSVELYRYEPSVGLKMSKIENYAKDIEQVLQVSGIRILAPIPDSGLVGFEVPLRNRSFPGLPEQQGFDIAVGETIMGDVRRFDIRQAPHILVAGASGSGKSVWLNGAIEQLLSTGEDLYLFDPKIVELAGFAGRAAMYETDGDRINEALGGLVAEMEERYRKLSRMGKKNVAGTRMPYKFVVIDEFGDLMIQNPEGKTEWEFCAKHAPWDKSHGGMISKIMRSSRRLRVREQEMFDEVSFCDKCARRVLPPFEQNLLRLAAKGRAAGIHLIIATQSPRAEIMKGSIKANFPVKVVFRTAKQTDSFVVIDEPGAEKLLGRGDMLFVGDGGVERLQGYNTK